MYLEVSAEEIKNRINLMDYLFYFENQDSHFGKKDEVLMIFAVQNKFAIYTGKLEYIALMSPWQYDKFVKKITKYTKNWKVHDNKNWAGDNYYIVINFDGAPREYCGNILCKNWKKLYKLVDCIRKGLTIL